MTFGMRTVDDHALNKEAPTIAGTSSFQNNETLRLLHLHRAEALRGLLHFVRHQVVLIENRIGTGSMNEDVITTSIRSDESKTFLVIEELHFTTCHTY